MKIEKKHIINELEDLDAEKLKTLKQTMPNISKNYFEEMQMNVFSKIKKEETEKIPKTKVFKIRYVFMAVAASLVVLLAIVLNTNKENNDFWATVSVSDLEKYLGENLEDFSEGEIASVSNYNDDSILSYSEISEGELQDFLLNTPITEDELY